MGVVAYKLLLPAESKIHPVFHVSQLKLADGGTLNPTALPTQLSSALELIVEPAEVLGIRKAPTEPMTAAQVQCQVRRHLGAL